MDFSLPSGVSGQGQALLVSDSTANVIVLPDESAWAEYPIRVRGRADGPARKHTRGHR